MRELPELKNAHRCELCRYGDLTAHYSLDYPGTVYRELEKALMHCTKHDCVTAKLLVCEDYDERKEHD